MITVNPRQEEPISHKFNKLPHSNSITKHTCRLKHAYNDLTRGKLIVLATG